MRSPAHRAAALVVVALVLLAPAGLAQVGDVKRPVNEPFERTFVVNGRVIDANGTPASNVDVEVWLDGLQGVKVLPERATTRCTGDFAVWFTLGTLTDGAKAFVRVVEEQGQDDEGNNLTLARQEASATIDTHFRKVDLTMQLKEDWPYDCQQMSSLWPHRLTLWGRLVNGTDPFDKDGTRLSARPLQGALVRPSIEVQEGIEHGTQWEVTTDARGDFIWSWVFEDNITQGIVRLYLGRDLVFNETWDGSDMRLVVANVDVGQGPPPAPQGLPGPGFLPVLGAIAAVALAFTWARARRR